MRTTPHHRALTRALCAYCPGAVATAISIGLREQSVLAGLFMCVATLLILVTAASLLPLSSHTRSAQAALVDYGAHGPPPPPLATRAPRPLAQAFGFLVEYNSRPKYLACNPPDPNARVLISQEEWQRDRPVHNTNAPNEIVGAESAYFAECQRVGNYKRRMIPHALGWFPISAAWTIIIVRIATQKLPHNPTHTLLVDTP